jgi:hypothetical protein
MTGDEQSKQEKTGKKLLEGKRRQQKSIYEDKREMGNCDKERRRAL